MTSSTVAWPTEIRLDKDKRTLEVSFDDGTRYSLPAEMLRVLSPSAEVKGHSPEQRVTVPGKRTVRIDTLEPVGNYAVKLMFSDGHETGIYSWDYLYELGHDFEVRWQRYLERLKEAGVERKVMEN